jgi:hypothetical protein
MSKAYTDAGTFKAAVSAIVTLGMASYSFVGARFRHANRCPRRSKALQAPDPDCGVLVNLFPFCRD